MKNPMQTSSYNVNSFFVAMARAISSGATTLRIYGCDMSGDRNAYREPVDGRCWDRRWQRDAKLLEQVVGLWVEDGISFDFRGDWSPPSILSACA